MEVCIAVPTVSIFFDRYRLISHRRFWTQSKAAADLLLPLPIPIVDQRQSCGALRSNHVYRGIWIGGHTARAR